MTRDKARKRAIRARMTKTGERYTTARHFTLDLHKNPERAGAGIVPDDVALPGAGMAGAGATPGGSGASSLPTRVADLGVSDDAVLRGTGAGWDEWLARLDAWGAASRTHAEIARYVQETYPINGWWAQSVTVGYERARGLRAVHERPDGFSVSVSKTMAVPVHRLYAAFVDDAVRSRWLEGIDLRPRTSTPHTTARFDLLPGDARVVVGFAARGPEKATVTVQVQRLADAGEVEHWRGIWKDQLARLADWIVETD